MFPNSFLSFLDQNLTLVYISGERKQTSAEVTKRSDDTNGIQRDGLSESTRATGRDPVSQVTEPLGPRRVDGSVERAQLGVGRTLGQRQGTAQRTRAQRRRVLVSHKPVPADYSKNIIIASK